MHFLIGFFIVCVIFAVPALRKVAFALIGLAVLLVAIIWLYTSVHTTGQSSTGSEQSTVDTQQPAPAAVSVNPIPLAPPPLPSEPVAPPYPWRGDARAYACADVGSAPPGYAPCVFPNVGFNLSYWHMNREERACANYYATQQDWSALEFCRSGMLR